MRNWIDRIEELWCVAMHDRAMWPIHGKYRCGTCLREYPALAGHADAKPAAPGRAIVVNEYGTPSPW
jgi:hypothetical protein